MLDQMREEMGEMWMWLIVNQKEPDTTRHLDNAPRVTSFNNHTAVPQSQ